MIPQKKVLLTIGAILGTIILGAIGSGLWERCIGPIFDWLTKLIVSGMSHVSHSYVDSLYADASRGFHEFFSFQLFCLYLTLLPMLYIVMLYRHPHLRKPRDEDKVRTFVRSKNGYYLLNVLTCAIIISMFFSLTRYSYINDICTVSRQSISILAPHISDQDLKELWARFYSMKSQDDFNSFIDTLKHHASATNTKIPAFTGLWSKKPDQSLEAIGAGAAPQNQR